MRVSSLRSPIRSLTIALAAVVLSITGNAFALVATTTTVTPTPSASTYGQSVSFDATVTGISGTPRKAVSLMEGATTLASQNVNGQNHAIITLTTLSVGTHTLLAVYEGNTNSAGSSSAPFTFIVSKAASTTTMTAPSAITYGGSASFTATVTGPGAVAPTGTVTFTESGNTLCSASLALVGGVPTATCNANGLNAGNHTILASYGGNGSYNSSDAATRTQTVNTATTTTSMISSQNPSISTDSVTFTATVSGAGTVGGTVDFFDGATKLNDTPIALTAGSAAFSTSALASGSHSITAVHNADSNHTGSTSGVVSQVVDLAATTTSLLSDANPSVASTSVTFTATVSSLTSGTISGTVDFYDGATKLNDAGVAISGGQAVFSTSALSVATHSITAVYSGDVRFATSTSSAVSQVVDLAATTTSLISDANPSVASVNVMFTATVSSLTAGTISGTVDFYDGATKLNDTGVAISGGQAAFSTSALSVATHSITAVYSGDATFATSTSSAVSQVVNLAATTTTLGAITSPVTAGDNVTLTATVASATAGTISGTVYFYDGATKLNDTGIAVSGGQAQFQTTSLASGSHSLTAQYSGDSVYATSTSSASNLDVRATTTTTLGSTPNPSKIGANVVFTATVTPSAATGTVDLVENNVTIASGPVSGGVATINVSILGVGSHTIEARYSGDSSYVPSTSSTITQAVTGRPRSDLNNDGHSDIVLQNTITSSIAAWLMSSNAILQGKVVASPVAAWRLLATGDLDGDGNADLILQNNVSGAIALWRMNGAVLAQGSAITTTSVNWRIVGTRDFNNDGKADIVVQNMVTGAVNLWLMNGASILSDNNLGTVSATTRVVGLGHLGGDAVVLQDTVSGTISRWIVSGTTVTSTQTVGTPASPDVKVLAVADFNSDGNDDLGLQNVTTRTVSVWLLSAPGDGVLSSGNVATPVAGWSLVGSGDYDGDGYGDLLMHNSITNGIAEWQMNGTVIARGWNVGTLAGWKPLGN